MTDMQTTRRRFLVAAITFSTVAAGTSSSLWLKSSAAWAQANDADGDLTEVLVRMARLLFPHDGLADEVYAGIIGGALAVAASDPAMSEVLRSAESVFDSRRDQPWINLDEAEQIAVMQEVQGEAFFAAILGTVRGHFYYNPEVWKHIDYPGSSREFGGYINRGFDDIDWLSEGS
jgi:hypothetical protein